MPAVDVLPTASEPLRRQLTTAGVGLTGATVRCDVRRSADGLVLDFADSTFKAVGAVGTRYRSLTAVDAVEWPGLYQGTALDLGAIVGGVAAGDVLTVTYYTTAPSALTLDQDELRVVAAGATAANVTDGTAAVLAGIITDHGAGSYVAPSVAGLALEATLTAMKGATFDTATDSLEALRNRGDAAWITGSGWAVAGDAMALTAGALTAVQAKVLSDATPFAGASIASILAFGAPPSAATVATQVWATAHGTPSVNTFGWLVWRHAQWGTEIADKAIVGQDLVLRSVDLATTYATVRLRDKDGNVIAPAVGETARFDPT